MSNKKLRLGLDLGSTSIGWALIELENNEPVAIKKCGVRIVPDGRNPKNQTPLTVTRTEHRGTRRNRDRYLTRSKDLIQILENNNLFPTDKKEKEELKKLDSLELRCKSLDNKIEKYEIGRAIWHLSKKRGFKSNRKVDSGDSNESSVIKQAIARLKDKLEDKNARTIGEYLYKLNVDISEHNQHHRKSTKFNNYMDKEDGIFPERALVIEEFDLIWDNQQSYYPELTDELRESIKQVIFRQRDLKAQLKGKCIFEPKEDRCPKASPYFQEFMLWQEINSIKVGLGKEQFFLANEEKDILFTELNKKKETKISAVLKLLFGKDVFRDYNMNLGKSDDKLKGNQLVFLLSKNEYFGKLWKDFSIHEQDELVDMILNDSNDRNNEERLKLKLDELKLTDQQQDKIYHAKLPAGYSNLSKKAIKKILPYLIEGKIYSEACQMAGYNHSGENIKAQYVSGNLPYYGQILRKHVIPIKPESDNVEEKYGRISNITVHIVLNQLRKLLNAIVLQYGKIDQISVEITRDLPLSTKQRGEVESKQKRNEKNNERIAKELEKHGQVNNYENRLKFKLWEELNENCLQRACVYSGENIKKVDLFSNLIQIEHILPFSKTFDDSYANKTVSYRDANNYKGNDTPFEAFGDSKDGYNYYEILERAKNIKGNKWKRFLSDAMEKYASDDYLIARLLNDTRYISRVAVEYLSYVVGFNNIWTARGNLTYTLRNEFGYNSILSRDNKKNREDHRHHAVDALVVALTSRALVQKFSKNTRRGVKQVLTNGQPYEKISRDLAQESILAIKTSFKPDHKVSKQKISTSLGVLHKDTAYGYVCKHIKDKTKIVVSERVDILTLTNRRNIEMIRDYKTRMELFDIFESSEDFKTDLKEYSKINNIKKVKILRNKSKDNMAEIKMEKGSKLFVKGNNFCVQIYEKILKAKQSREWTVEVISMYDKHQKGFIPNWRREYPTAKKIMELFINDVVALDVDGVTEYRRVRKMTGRYVYLTKIEKTQSEGDNLETYSGSILLEQNARKVTIDVLGNVKDHKGRKYANIGGKSK